MAESGHPMHDRRRPQFEPLSDGPLPPPSGQADEQARPFATDRPHRVFGLSFALFVFAADQALKWFIIGPLNLRAVGNIHLLPIFDLRSEEHTSELQSLMRISYAVFCLKKKKNKSSNRLTP